MPIFGIDMAQLRIGEHEHPLDAHIAISLPQHIHCPVDPLLLVPFDIAFIEGQLYIAICLDQPCSPDADAPHWLIPVIACPKQIKSDLGDLCAGTGGILKFSLPGKRIKFGVPGRHLHHRTPGCQFSHTGSHALCQQEQHQKNIIFTRQIPWSGGAVAHRLHIGDGIYIAARKINAVNTREYLEQFRKVKEYLNSARPTAVNLSWALNRMESCVEENLNTTCEEITVKLRALADRMKDEDVLVCKSIGEYALDLLCPNDGILMHCNPGALATVRYGTATAPIYLGQERGYRFHVYADETRPLLQGARLTAYELQSAGINVTLICDNMASSVMANGWVQAVIVGCDRVAANGDTANKIGTSGVAILANYYHIPVYICAPTSTIDLKTKNGGEIKIEQRPAEEVTEAWYKQRMAPEGVDVYNPCFDVTDHSLITGIITEFGIAYPPYAQSLPQIFRKKEKNEGLRN